MVENVISLKEEKLKRRRALALKLAKDLYQKKIRILMANHGMSECEAKEILKQRAIDRIRREELEGGE